MRIRHGTGKHIRPPCFVDDTSLVTTRAAHQALIIALLLVFSVVMFYPFVWLFFSSFKTGADIVGIPIHLLPEQWTLSAYAMVMNPERANLPRPT